MTTRGVDTTATGWRISEVATRTGFTATTLRYYEQIGLIAPPRRTDAGYRVYDDRAVARLTFVGRAKQLGLSLDEITELAGLWDGGACAPVQHRLVHLLDARRHDLRARIAALVELADQLDRVAADMPTVAPPGPCDDACGCATAPAPIEGRPVAFTTRSERGDGDAPATVAIACSLTGAEQGSRLAAWDAVLTHVTGREAVAGGLVLRFPPTPGLAGELAELAAAEQACCSFFSFRLVLDGDGPVLEVRAPADAADVVASLFGTAA
jgi:DNA-binding transcriptional MerR regulator